MKRRAWRRDPMTALLPDVRITGFFLAVWCFLAGLPVLLLTVASLGSLLRGGQPEPWSTLIPTGRRLPLFGQTLLFALCVAVLGTLVGLFAAGAVQYSRIRAVRALRYTLLPMIIIPPHIHALAWGALVRDLNRQFRVLGRMTLPEQGFAPAVWVQTMALLPFAFGVLYLGFRALPDEVAEAAVMLGSGSRAALRVLLPLQGPGVSASFLFLFLVSLLDYSVPSIFQLNLYTLTIFSEYSIRYDAVHAFLLSMPLLAVSLPAVWGLQRALRRIPLSMRKRSFQPVLLQGLSWFRIPILTALLVSTLQWLAPLFSLFREALPSFSDTRWLASSLPDLRGTLFTGLLAALMAIPLSWAAAEAIHARQVGCGIWWWLLMLPLAMPAPLVGIGLIHIWNGPLLGWTGGYTTLLMPALAVLLRFLPFSVLVVLSALKRQDNGCVEACLILQKDPLHGLVTIRLPLLGGALGAAGILAAVLSFSELGATLLLLPPGAGSLTIRIYNYLHYGQSDVVAGLCLVLFVLALAMGALLKWLYGRQR